MFNCSEAKLIVLYGGLRQHQVSNLFWTLNGSFRGWKGVKVPRSSADDYWY